MTDYPAGRGNKSQIFRGLCDTIRLEFVICDLSFVIPSRRSRGMNLAFLNQPIQTRPTIYDHLSLRSHRTDPGSQEKKRSYLGANRSTRRALPCVYNLSLPGRK